MRSNKRPNIVFMFSDQQRYDTMACYGADYLEIPNLNALADQSFVFQNAYVSQPVCTPARAMKAGMVYIEPILSESGVEPLGTVIMGTVKGDLHDIGKNLCIMMLRGAGFNVIDLGVDTSAEEFIEAIEDNEANVVGMSALLTTTMPNMGKTIQAFEEVEMRDIVKVMVGGAPLTQEFADDMGADGYGKDAISCVDLAKSFYVVK